MFHYDSTTIEASNGEAWLTIITCYVNRILSSDPIRFYWGITEFKSRQLIWHNAQALFHTQEYFHHGRCPADFDHWIGMYNEIREHGCQR